MKITNKRKIINIYDVKFKPFDNYGSPVPGMSWHKISYFSFCHNCYIE